MCKKAFLLWLLALSVSAQRPPNIVFILADDLGYTDLGCYGNPFNKTPYLDTLASRGLLFTQAYSASPVCSPSRAAILTGKHPARLHLTNFINGNRRDSLSSIEPALWKPYLSTDELTLAERLKKIGYNTGMVGKWHLGNGTGQNPWEQGFDYSRMIGKNGLDYYNYSIYEDGFDKSFEDKGTHYLTDKLTSYALEFLSAQSKEDPYFLYLTYSAPHVLIVPRGDKLKNYLFRYNAFDGQYNPYYAAMLESLDEGVGAIYEKVKARGELENTLFVFTSDNGGVGLDELGPVPTNLQPLRKWKGHIYEGGNRVPLLVSWKGKIQEGAKSQFAFSNVDFSETILDVLGAEEDVSPDSRSVKDAFFNPDLRNQDVPVFWHYPHFSNQLGVPASSVRFGDYKLIQFYEDSRLELYNLADDISELRDIHLDEPAKTRELYALLDSWRSRVNANLPVKK